MSKQIYVKTPRVSFAEEDYYKPKEKEIDDEETSRKHKKIKSEKLSENKAENLENNEGDYSFSESCDEDLELEGLVGLAKRIAIQHKLVASNRKINLEITRLMKELEGYLIPIVGNVFLDLKFRKDDYPLLSFRKAVIRIALGIKQLSQMIVNNPIFEGFIIAVILLNVFILALDRESSTKNSSYTSLNYFFLFTYTVECILKIFAFGLIIFKHSYLRDWWNILDFTIVLTLWISIYGTSSVTLSSLRIIRILRPLRGLSSIEGMRILIQSLFMSIKPLLNSLIILCAFASLFSIIGLQLWSGAFRYKCLNVDYGTFSNFCGSDTCLEGELCSHGIKNPYYGTMSFDSFFYAILNVFQILTLEGWTEILLYTEMCFSYFSIIYFFPLVILGSLLILNLTVAVVTTSFTTSLGQSVLKKNKKSAVTLSVAMKHYRKVSYRGTVIPYDILYSHSIKERTEEKRFTIQDLLLSAIDHTPYEVDVEINKVTLSPTTCNESAKEVIDSYFMAPTLFWRNSKKYQHEMSMSFNYAQTISLRCGNKKIREKLIINEKLNVESSSFDDIIKITREPDKYSEGFYQELIQKKIALQKIEILQAKYLCDSPKSLFFYLKKRTKKNRAFFQSHICSKNFISNINSSQNHRGEWSGDDILNI